MSTGKRMKDRRKALGLKAEDVAAVLGCSRSTIFRYENGDIEKVPTAALEPIAAALSTSPAYLMGWTDDPTEFLNAKEKMATENESLKIPQNLRPAVKRRYKYLGEIACGEPIFADEQYETYIDLEADIRADFVLKAKGDSMINARIHDGDLVFIREQPTIEDGEIAAVIIDDEATLKRVYKYDDHITLNAENPAYKPIQVRANEGKNVRIIGKAVAATIYLK